ncbi:FAD/NAD(P)-binding protein [Solihabitans fulvus]|uniref:FAD/NAD(P)-binding protein n=1 Tax=Solihabitans fulvus TaxID=1892852 RepID=A0A5B2WUZ5_9PSEU|nr:FAD/NAD(P)-binding protein [Solihabitans fulvus]KAA2254286.1 FAD/NAD(P)-binding protein [Solihabitans fulvus]
MTHPEGADDVAEPFVVAVLGAGPRATGLLERIAANAAELPLDRPVHVHLVDPHPPGAGRVWRHDQSPLLRMNSMAEDVTMFTDDSVQCAGPISPGPSLIEWAEMARAGRLPEFEVAADVLDEVRELAGTTFPTRRLQSQYLSWVFDHVVAGLPPNFSVRVHRTTATRVTGNPLLRQRVWLADRTAPLLADIVVLTLGHLDAVADPEHQELAEFADRHDLEYLPPAYSADVDLDGFRAGENLVLRGFGLAFVDLMVLLTEGRGGEFTTEPDGELRYLPSGREPRIHVGSRRGIPYHAKTGYRLQGGPLRLPRFFDAAAVDELLTGERQLDFRLDVWPLLAKEIAWGHYQELFAGHPDRVQLPWRLFAKRFAALLWYSKDMRDLVERAVPAAEDRVDFERLDLPLDGLRFDSADDLQRHVRDYVRADIDRRANPAYSADLGAFLALLSIFGQLPRVLGSGRLAAGSRVADVDGWWFGFFSYLASGPPPHRLEQLLALSRAGVVRFLGADMWVRADERRGVFVAGSVSSPETVDAVGLVDARLPDHAILRSTDPLLRSLLASGDGVDEVLSDGGEANRYSTGLLRVTPEECRVVDSSGRAHPRRFALGPFTNGRSFAAFARPGTNAPAFRQNDSAARGILRFLAALEAVHRDDASVA